MNIEKLIHLFQNTHNELQSRVARSVDAYLVVRNWLFGWYIVEFENGGAERAELYGKRLIDILSESLSTLGIKGMSPTNLRKFREFYQNYKIQQALPVISPNANQKIQQALPAELDKFPETMQNTIEYLSSRFVLGWTHYVTLMTVK
ncbi:DUF1016 domain-containing protein, partial [bacterium]|nr:DUF1016 domain-containing protein [bacterium]